ncbi:MULTISPECIES: glycoside hydrolase family 71 protein [Olivibacter]|uniref:Glycoside hydrolase family 71 protein n=1 Tax=Olivibacter jilunii TaxID=985016 RepID=A0ABW6B5Q3_9SPHI
MKAFVFFSCLLGIIGLDLGSLSKSEQVEFKNDFRQNEDVLPFDRPSISILRKSKKKVFAHYFTQFPISIDNKDPKSDYYSEQYLNPLGEKGKHKEYGGYLRARPLPRASNSSPNWRAIDFGAEIKLATDIGIDGFACNILSFTGRHWEKTKMLFSVAQNTDRNFKIMIMPDMNSVVGKNPDQLEDIVSTLSKYKSAYRLEDGRLVVAPYNAQKKTASWWKAWLNNMHRKGIDIAFVPVFQGWAKYAEEFSSISYGMSDWGVRSPSRQVTWKEVPKRAKNILSKVKVQRRNLNSAGSTEVWMMPVAPQDFRPRAYAYWEADNSAAFRLMWMNAIEGDADWVQLITWNDYAENTMISPNTATKYGFYDLTAFYVSWFKLGRMPVIKRDVLYYFYRNSTSSAKPENSLQKKVFVPARGSDEPKDEIELLAFLTKPGRLEIEIAGKKYSKEFGSGIQSFKVPAVEGTPKFKLIRNGAVEISFNGDVTISNKIIYQNLLYFSGSNSRKNI